MLQISGISLHNFPEGMAVFLGSIKVYLPFFVLFRKYLFFTFCFTEENGGTKLNSKMHMVWCQVICVILDEILWVFLSSRMDFVSISVTFLVLVTLTSYVCEVVNMSWNSVACFRLSLTCCKSLINMSDNHYNILMECHMMLGSYVLELV